jgi:hypothetical protein
MVSVSKFSRLLIIIDFNLSKEIDGSSDIACYNEVLIIAYTPIAGTHF